MAIDDMDVGGFGLHFVPFEDDPELLVDTDARPSLQIKRLRANLDQMLELRAIVVVPFGDQEAIEAGRLYGRRWLEPWQERAPDGRRRPRRHRAAELSPRRRP